MEITRDGCFWSRAHYRSPRDCPMYCEYYEFKEKPFTITPNPRFIFLSKNHQEAFAHLLYGIDNHAGFIEFIGEIGTGKTTVLRTLLGELDESRYRTALIFNPSLSAIELLRSINREYGIPGEGAGNAELLQELNRFLLRENAEGRTVVLVIDEAQNLEPTVLEQIRLISNLETETDKLIQIVLAGQPELGNLLAKPELRQLAQRITVRYHLRPMDFEDMHCYINHRMTVAGCGRAVHFTDSALKRIFRYSGGTPRLINVVCDRALLIGYAEEHREFSGRLIKSAINEIRRESNLYPSTQLRWLTGLCLVVVFAGCIYGIRHSLPSKATQASVQFADALLQKAGKRTAADFAAAVAEELAEVREMESTVTAFNVLARSWNVEPAVSFTATSAPKGLNQLARKRDLRLLRIKGDLKTLLRFNSPALLEYSQAGMQGKRFFALTGTHGDHLLIAPPLLGRSSFTAAELESLWSGNAYLLWKNYRNIPVTLELAAKGSKVTDLQQMLGLKGFYKGKPNGMYDGVTIKAVKAFQSAKGITSDGRVGALTLLVLYRDAGRFFCPTLTRKEGGSQG
jgi:general secretion pathway protein A